MAKLKATRLVWVDRPKDMDISTFADELAWMLNSVNFDCEPHVTALFRVNAFILAATTGDDAKTIEARIAQLAGNNGEFEALMAQDPLQYVEFPK